MQSKRCAACGAMVPSTRTHYSGVGEICERCHEEGQDRFRFLGSYVGSTVVAVFGSLVCWLFDPAWLISVIAGGAALRTAKIAPSIGPKVAAAVALLLVAGHVAWDLSR